MYINLRGNSLMEWNDGDYKISDDKSLISLDKVCELLSKSYWAAQRPKEKNELAIKNSVCYGVYYKAEQIGYARLVTDFCTVYWLCDVIIDETFRGKGLGKKLIECIVESDEFKDKCGILGTKDAHGLYEKYGFKKYPERFMCNK